MEKQEPQGVPFFNVKSGETMWAKTEAQIQAFINSSDMGINASRDQDFGWRLAPEWVKKVRTFRRDEVKMERLTSRNGGQKVTTPQILYTIYGDQVRAYQERIEEDSAPFEEQYLQDISGKNEQPKVAVQQPDDIPETVDDEDLEPSEETVTSDKATAKLKK
jgi:hypothetical protein